MIADSENKKFDMILVHEYSRFASNYELSKSLEEKLKKNNITVISITEKTDNTPNGFFQRLIMQGLAEWRLRNLAEHVKKSQKYMVSEKGLNHGSSCFGYNMIDKKLVVNQEEAKIVKIIFDMYVSGNGCHKIQDFLNKNKLYSRRGKMLKFFTILYMLRNVKYIGKLRYNGGIYEGQHEAIIDEEIFNRVQKEINRRSSKIVNLAGPNISRKSKKWYSFYLLSILHCGECGMNMRVCQSGNKLYSYYMCGKAMKYTGECKFTKVFKTEIIEKEIENELFEFLKGDLNFTAKINYEDNTRDILEKRLSKIPEEIKRIQEGFISGFMTIEFAKKKKLELEEEQQQLQKEIENMQNNVFDIEEQREGIKTIWESFIHEKDICKKRELLKNEIEKIYIDKTGHIEIVFVDKSDL